MRVRDDVMRIKSWVLLEEVSVKSRIDGPLDSVNVLLVSLALVSKSPPDDALD